MPAVAGRLPHQGTEIRRVLETIAAQPLTTQEIAAMLDRDTQHASAVMARQKVRGQVVRVDPGPVRGRYAVAVYALSEAARLALRIEQTEGRRVALMAA